MKLLFIRHADPEYTIDSLTKKGEVEAELLSERIRNLNIHSFYVSPLGRAKDTAAVTLNKMNREAVECTWLREFAPRIQRFAGDKRSVAWDWLPSDWTRRQEFYDKEQWCNTDVMKEGNVDEEYRWVTSEFDRLLMIHGYEREKNYYRVNQPNDDTIVFFCHFGIICVLLSHLLGISPMPLWHGTCAAPSSVTTVNTEERRKGIAGFRMSSFGDISHLYVQGEEPAFSGRFCECFHHDWERHD